MTVRALRETDRQCVGHEWELQAPKGAGCASGGVRASGSHERQCQPGGGAYRGEAAGASGSPRSLLRLDKRFMPDMNDCATVAHVRARQAGHVKHDCATEASVRA